MKKSIKKLRKYALRIIINATLAGLAAFITLVVIAVIVQLFSIFQMFGIPAMVTINVLLANILGYMIVGKADEE